MSEKSLPEEELSPELLRQLEGHCEQFEAGWQSGTPLRLEDQLAEAPEELRSALVRKLVALEIHHRRARGDTGPWLEYRERFPKLTDEWLAAALEGSQSMEADTPPASLRESQPLTAEGDADPPIPVEGSVLKALGASLPVVPRILLRDPDSVDRSPLVWPSSGEMPAPQDSGVRLQLQGEIARGGMGAILQGRDTDLGRDIAVKVLLETHAGKPELVQRFVEEAQISGQLQHPGITPVYELGRFADKRPYFTMKLVKGKTLAALLADRSDRDPAQMARFVTIYAQVCQTLAYAHARGVIHRDLKPSNVMVGSFGEVQVMDWGLAKVLPQGGIADEKQERTRIEVSIIRTSRSQAGDLPGSSNLLTEAGSVLGTPAYMAPEQARGDVDLVDERADVFGLGAMLCEILTGRPPFTGKGAEAQRRAQTAKLEDANARLEACGADGELVALARRCLAAEPWDRPRDARQVAHAMTAYQETVANRLREAELERAAAEARTAEEARTRQMAEAKAAEERKRRRVTLALAVAVLALAVLGGSAVAWWWQERTAAERDVAAALAEAATHREAGRWPEARAALERAEGRLGTWGLKDHRERLRQARLDSDLVAELDGILLAQSDTGEGTEQPREQASARYTEVFQKYGIELESQTPSEAAAVLAGSSVREQLLEGLYAWLSIQPEEQRNKLLALLDNADDNVWRKTFRMVLVAKDTGKLKELAKQPEALSQPPTVQCLLGSKLVEAGEIKDAESLLRQGQHRHPADFWLNQYLAITLSHKYSSKAEGQDEVIGYFRAAVAIRPTSATAHRGLGVALHEKGDHDGAIAQDRQAIALDPNNAIAHNTLGGGLRAKGDLNGAINEIRQAIALDPKKASFHSNLSRALRAKGDLNGAIDESRQAIALDPKNASVHGFLGLALQAKDDLNGAIDEYRQAIAFDPKTAWYHNALAFILSEKGDLHGAIVEYRQASALDPNNPWWHHQLADLLSTCPDLKLRDSSQAITEAKRAIELRPQEGWFWNSLGEAYYSAGQWRESIQALEKAITLSKKGDFYIKEGGDSGDFFYLAMAHWQLGHKDEATRWYQKGVTWMDQNPPKSPDERNYHTELQRLGTQTAKLVGVPAKK